MIWLELELVNIGGVWHQEECPGQEYNAKNVTGFLLIILQVSL